MVYLQLDLDLNYQTFLSKAASTHSKTKWTLCLLIIISTKCKKINSTLLNNGLQMID